jgi:hypothetical protein
MLPPTQVPARSIGPEPAALRETTTRGHVLAVLRTAVYLEAAGGEIIALTGPAVPNGPLTVRLPDLAPLLPALHTRHNAPFRATPAALEIEGATRIPWAQATGWTPSLPAIIGPPAARTAAAQALSTLLTEHAPLESAAHPLIQRLQMISPNTPLSLSGSGAADEGRSTLTPAITTRLAAHSTALAAAWRDGDTAATAAAAVLLLGLGPGLTPSGDDILMGLLAALHWQARLGALPPDPVATLTATVQAAAPRQTTRLSTRLLHYAAQGILYEPAMTLGTALLAGDPAAVAAPAHALCAIGHTSGADMALGLLIGTLLAC